MREFRCVSIHSPGCKLLPLLGQLDNFSTTICDSCSMSMHVHVHVHVHVAVAVTLYLSRKAERVSEREWLWTQSGLIMSSGMGLHVSMQPVHVCGVIIGFSCKGSRILGCLLVNCVPNWFL